MGYECGFVEIKSSVAKSATDAWMLGMSNDYLEFKDKMAHKYGDGNNDAQIIYEWSACSDGKHVADKINELLKDAIIDDSPIWRIDYDTLVKIQIKLVAEVLSMMPTNMLIEYGFNVLDNGQKIEMRHIDGVFVSKGTERELIRVNAYGWHENIFVMENEDTDVDEFNTFVSALRCVNELISAPMGDDKYVYFYESY